MSIVLKDQNAADVVFQHVETAPNTLVFVSRGDSLLDVKKLTLTLNESAKVNRVKWKLTVPTVKSDVTTGLPVVSYTQVASGDLSVVKFSSQADRTLICALQESLLSTTVVKDLVVSGAFPV